ncbi:MAG: hypothetical protein M1827_007199 [Pycnora praestabilis]|nr:MAG: hypothetical protein M1827_007199 [Pycnora praestabilis]
MVDEMTIDEQQRPSNEQDVGTANALVVAAAVAAKHASLKHHLLGPSLTKAGQDSVDQNRVSEIIYNASKGSKFFSNEEVKDKNLTQKIERILSRKRQLERIDLASELRRADEYIAELELSRDLSQTVVHIDCDAFYAAVEELDRPDLKHVPMAVGKGVLTTCNYHARKFGCRSGMAGFVALRLCPDLICLPLNFEKYTAKAQEVRKIIAEYDPRFESASIDEAYLNITQYCEDNQIDSGDAVTQLRNEVAEKTKITISAGIAANGKIAKIASNRNKPNGQFRVANDRATVMAFMRDLPTRKVNGVGRVFERELEAIGVKTCGDIYSHRAYLAKLFGDKAFQFLMNCYLGLGRTTVQPAEEHERKSVGTESTFKDMSGKTDLREKLRWIAEELEKDLVRTQFKGRTLVLKVKLHTYEVLTRQVIPPKAVHLADDLYNYSLPMLSKLEKDIPGMTLRLMGLRVTHIVSMKRNSLDFFGLKSTSSTDSDQGIKRKATTMEEDGTLWEAWPEEEFEEAARQERQEEIEEMEILSQEEQLEEANRRRKAGRDILPNPRAEQVVVPEVSWDCPICSRPQAPNDKEFNDHIDFCLSKQTIKEAVKNTSAVQFPNVRGDGTSQLAIIEQAPLAQRLALARLRHNVHELQAQVEQARSLRPPTRKVFQCVVDDTAFIDGIPEIQYWVSSGSISIIVPLSTLDQLDKLKNGTEDTNKNAREAIRFLDRAQSGIDKLPSGSVKLQGPTERYPTWAEAEKYLLQEYAPETEGGNEGVKHLPQILDETLGIKAHLDTASSSSAETLDKQRLSTSTMSTASSNTSLEYSQVAVAEAIVKPAVASRSPQRNGSRPVSAERPRVAESNRSNRSHKRDQSNSAMSVPNHIQPLLNCTIWRLNKVPSGGGEIDSYMLVTNSMETQKWMQKFGITVNRLDQLKGAITRETKDFKSRMSLFEKQNAAQKQDSNNNDEGDEDDEIVYRSRVQRFPRDNNQKSWDKGSDYPVSSPGKSFNPDLAWEQLVRPKGRGQTYIPRGPIDPNAFGRSTSGKTSTEDEFVLKSGSPRSVGRGRGKLWEP